MTRTARDDGRRPTGEWARIDGGRGKFATWSLVGTEYYVEHCGHPTANYPWYGTRPDGSMITSGPGGLTGYAFRYLDDAKLACELDRVGRRHEIGLIAEHRTKASIARAERIRRTARNTARRSA